MIRAETICDHFGADWTAFYAGLVDIPSTGHNGSVKIRSPLRDDDDTPSFLINLHGDRAGQWHDFGTAEHGDAFGFFQRMRGLLTFSEVVAAIASEFGITGCETKLPKEVRSQKEQDSRPTPEEAREKAERIWNAATPATEDHPYLKRKGVKSYGLRVDNDGALLVRVTDGAELVSLQLIFPDAKKRFLTGGRTAACYYPIGDPPDDVLYIAEGYATAATIHEVMGGAVAAAFSSGQLLAVATALREKYPNLRIMVCADDDADKVDNPGLTSARKAAGAVEALLAVPDFGENRPDDASDFNDLCRHAGAEAVRDCIERAEPVARTEPVTAVGLLDAAGVKTDLEGVDAVAYSLRQLARQMSAAGVDELLRAAVREEAVTRLKDVIKSPARLVDAALRVHTDGDDDKGQGQRLLLTDPEPWNEPVDGADLLAEVARTIARYVVLPEGAATTVALWVVFSHAHNLGVISTYLSIVSPMKRCGKSTLLTLVGALVPRPLPASNISPAALFRAVEAFEPSLLIDEADSFLKGNEDLRGIINSGHTRHLAYVVRCDGDSNEPRAFSTWCPKVICMIGKPPDTIADRSVIVPMRRKRKGEQAEQLRSDKLDLEALRSKASHWVADNTDALRGSHPAVPGSLDDRASDNWRRLLVVADCAGGVWPERARKAAVILSGAKEDDAAGTLLLEDLKLLFDAQEDDGLTSAKIVEELVKMEGRPWPEWRRGMPITKNGLARLLKPFGVKPRSLRNAGDVAKGYKRADLEDAFSRYLTPNEPSEGRNPPDAPISTVTTLQPAPALDSGQNSNRYNAPNVTDGKTPKPVSELDCNGVTVENPPSGGEGELTPETNEDGWTEA